VQSRTELLRVDTGLSDCLVPISSPVFLAVATCPPPTLTEATPGPFLLLVWGCQCSPPSLVRRIVREVSPLLYLDCPHQPVKVLAKLRRGKGPNSLSSILIKFFMCARSLFPETGDTIITEEVRKFPTRK
jgi:hypothetical protein